ncbi:hypothetical protein C8Q74DRAFT_1217252 [Fomes fomentarius]|nr:hypothetical protein C8Q74DRAFT_1217252 [Fomes fomentarius]
MKCSVLVALSLALAASAATPHRFGRRQDFKLKNGQDAIALNQKFAGLNENSPCQTGEDACIADKFAQCVNGKFVAQACAPGTIDWRNSCGCSAPAAPPAQAPPPPAADPAPPAAGDNAAGGGAAAGDAQTSTTLLASVIAQGFTKDGQQTPAANQVASLTSSNNFINFCATVNKAITNGKQIKEGSCNPAPMGVIASTANMPSSKFVNPKNGATIPANTDFTIQMAIKNLETGNFVNAQENFFAAPQVVNDQGNIRGHSHVVVEKLPSLDTAVPTDPNTFAFFKGLNDKDQGGVLSVTVPGGLPAGAYRLASINAAANHQPVLVAVAQHGALDDMVYFTVA